MKRVYLTLTSLIAPIAVGACAGSNTQVAAPAPAHAPMPPAWVSAEQPTTAPAPTPMLASAESPAAAPTTAPAPAARNVTSGDLPSGHPDIAQLMEQRKQKMGKARMNGELPAGHPPIGDAANAGATPGPIPAQKPTNLFGPAMQPGTTQPAVFGTVIVRAVQGTKGGSAIGELPVTIDLVQGENVLDTKKLQTAPDGTLRLDNIPLSMNVAPVVKVNYNGVEYTAAGGVMDGTHAEQQVQVPVFETTEAAPAWTIKMQHVMLEPTVEGVRVMEMLAIDNPTDRSWIGTAPASAGAKRRTLSFSLPQGATDVSFGGGLHDCCTTVENGKVYDSMALVPGVSQYRIGYTLPVNAGKAHFEFATAAPVKHLMVFLPDGGAKVSASGIADGGVADMGGGKTRFFRGADVAAGTPVKLSISEITARAAATAAGADGKPARAPALGGASARTAKIVAGIGGLAIFVIGGMVLMFKAPKSKKA